MAQATCVFSLAETRHVRKFPYWTGPDYGFRQPFCLQYRATKGNFEKPQKCNEFSKLNTKSCMSRTMNNLKESFTVMKAIITRKTTLTLCVCIGLDLQNVLKICVFII